MAFLLCQNVLAQNFFKSYGNSNDEIGQSVIEMQDTSYLIFGTSSSFIDGTANFYLMRIDSLGNFQWSKTYGGNNVERGYDICYKPNRNYLLTGYSNSYGNGYEVYAIEVDSVGNELWSKTYGGNDWDFAYSNMAFPNGDVLITGNTYSFGNGDSDGFLLMIDNNGDSLWWKNYGTATENILRQSILTTDNEILSIGSTVTTNGDKDIYLIKCNLLGDTIWTKTYGTNLDDEGNTLLQSTNGNYILGGSTRGLGAGGLDGYYFEIDTSGSVIWTQTYGGADDEQFNSIIIKPNESRFYVAYESNSFGNGEFDFVINSFYTSGGWYNASNTYGTLMTEKGYDIIFTSHKRVLAVGYTDFPYDNQNVMVVMSDTLLPTQSSSSLVDYIDVTGVNENNVTVQIKIYPNPAHSILNIETIEIIQSISIYDLTGKLVESRKGNLTVLDVENLPSSYYLMQIELASGQILSTKLIITKQ